jgi:chromosome segregation ATPase
MASSHDHAFDATRPALVLLFGSTTKTHRMLDRSEIVIGRAHGCDLGLEAPDVSSVHCIISRGPNGFHVRDCQSRAGTKHNGNNVRDAVLRDGDLLQIGPFSFRVHLPAGCVVGQAASASSHLDHLKRSRRNLARMALRQRKLLRLVRVINKDGDGKAVKGQLSNQLLSLKARIRDYDQRVRVLEDAERDLARDRETLDREIATFRAEAQQANQQPVLAEQLKAFEQQKKEFFMAREQWARDQASILARLGEQQTALAQVEETVRRQRQDLGDVLIALQEGRPAGDSASEGEVRQLRAEMEQLKQFLATVEHEREQAATALAEAQAAATTTAADNTGEVELLRRQLKEMDALLEEARAKPAEPPVEKDVDSYEADLNEFRRQLESDRSKLTKEIEQLRARNKELDETTRELELEMSRERAELARERQRLERLRDDVRQELERIQRDGGLRDRLTPVQNLRDEINQRRHPGVELPTRQTPEDAMQARLRTLRNKVNEQ